MLVPRLSMVISTGISQDRLAVYIYSVQLIWIPLLFENFQFTVSLVLKGVGI